MECASTSAPSRDSFSATVSQPFGVAPAHNKLGAQSRELKSDCFSDPAPRAGNEHYLAGKQAVPERQRHAGKLVVAFSELLGHTGYAVFAVWCALCAFFNEFASVDGTGIG